MQITREMTDDAVLAELGERLRRVRLQRGQLTQERLAEEAGVSTATVARLEAGQSTQCSSLIRILRQLELLDDMERLVPEPALSPIELLERKERPRQRVRRQQPGPLPAANVEPWRWGDEGDS